MIPSVRVQGGGRLRTHFGFSSVESRRRPFLGAVLWRAGMWGVCPGPHMGPMWLQELALCCHFFLHGHTEQACPPGLWIPGSGAVVQPE